MSYTPPVLHHVEWNEDFYLSPDLGRYGNDELAITLIDDIGEPFCTLTVNLPHDMHRLGEREVFIKNWSENANVVQSAMLAGWLVDVSRYVDSNHVAVPVMRLSGILLRHVEKMTAFE